MLIDRVLNYAQFERWLKNNDTGISTVNIRWLARIFWMDDPQRSADGQMEAQ